MSFSLKNVFKSPPPLKSHKGEPVTLHPTFDFSSTVWTPRLQNQDLNLITLLNCRRGNAGNLHTITFWGLLKSQPLWSCKSRRSLGGPLSCTADPTSGRAVRSKRQTSGEVFRINYCRQINPHIAEIYNAGFVRMESSPPSLPKHPIRQDLHMDKNWLYYFSPPNKRIAIILKIYRFWKYLWTWYHLK